MYARVVYSFILSFANSYLTRRSVFPNPEDQLLYGWIFTSTRRSEIHAGKAGEEGQDMGKPGGVEKKTWHLTNYYYGLDTCWVLKMACCLLHCQ